VQPAGPAITISGPSYAPPPSGLRKAGVIVAATLVGLGGFLVFAGFVWAYVFPPSGPPGTGRLIIGILYAGLVTGFGGSLLGAFASPKDEPMQKLGMFVLAAVFLFAMTTLFRPSSYVP